MATRRRLPSAKELAYLKQWHRKTPRFAIAKAIGVNIKTLDKWVAEHIKGKPATLSKIEQFDAEFTALWHAGVALETLAEKFNRSVASMRGVRCRLKLPARRQDHTTSPMPWSKEEEAILRALYRRNAVAWQMADALPGRTLEGVRAQLTKLNLFRNRERAGAKKGRALPDLTIPKVRECLMRHGACPLWRIRDYAGVDHRTAKLALRRMAKRNEVVFGGTQTKGLWSLAGAPQQSEANAEQPA